MKTISKTSRRRRPGRFGPLPKVARLLRRSPAQARMQAARHRPPRRRAEAAAATFLPGRLRKSRGKSPQRGGDRVVYHAKMVDAPFERVEELFELLDEG
ncbi:hypothetical protein ACU4GH_38635 [Bradyrhizobium betae]